MSVVLYNCKRCKRGRRVEYPNVSRVYRGSYTRTDDAGRIWYPGAFIVASGGGRPTAYDGDPLGLCDGCGRPMKWSYVQGRHNPDVRCDARCTNARGGNCECSCGGANHGMGWAA